MTDKETTKIGDGHLAAMARLGVHELRNAMYADSNVAQRHGEYGIYGNATPQEIVAARQGKDADKDGPELGDQQESVLADRLQQAVARDDHGRDDKALDRE